MSLIVGQNAKEMEVHQAQADALISAAVDDQVNDVRLACAEGSRLTARVRNVRVAWDEQL